MRTSRLVGPVRLFPVSSQGVHLHIMSACLDGLYATFRQSAALVAHSNTALEAGERPTVGPEEWWR